MPEQLQEHGIEPPEVPYNMNVHAVALEYGKAFVFWSVAVSNGTRIPASII